jgi:cytochrome c oxidase subunit 4
MAAHDIQHVPTPGSGAHADGGESHVRAHAHHGGDYHVHVVPPWLLIAVFVALLILTGITVGVTVFDFGRTINVWIALAVAVAKATLVALFFMHLRWDSPFNGVILVTALFFVALFIGTVILDSKEYQINMLPPTSTSMAP